MYSCPRARRGVVVPRCMGHKLHISDIRYCTVHTGDAQGSGYCSRKCACNVPCRKAQGQHCNIDVGSQVENLKIFLHANMADIHICISKVIV